MAMSYLSSSLQILFIFGQQNSSDTFILENHVLLIIVKSRSITNSSIITIIHCLLLQTRGICFDMMLIWKEKEILSRILQQWITRVVVSTSICASVCDAWIIGEECSHPSICCYIPVSDLFKHSGTYNDVFYWLWDDCCYNETIMKRKQVLHNLCSGWSWSVYWRQWIWQLLDHDTKQ